MQSMFSISLDILFWTSWWQKHRGVQKNTVLIKSSVLEKWYKYRRSQEVGEKWYKPRGGNRFKWRCLMQRPSSLWNTLVSCIHKRWKHWCILFANIRVTQSFTVLFYLALRWAWFHLEIMPGNHTQTTSKQIREGIFTDKSQKQSQGRDNIPPDIGKLVVEELKSRACIRTERNAIRANIGVF